MTDEINIPILIGHDYERGAVGQARIMGDKLKGVPLDKFVFAPGWIQRPDGGIELLEISLVPLPKEWDKRP